MDINKNKKPELAFPSEIRSDDGSAVINLGMSLRDYFAAQAMQGLVNAYKGRTLDLGSESYKIADAMLKARGE